MKVADISSSLGKLFDNVVGISSDLLTTAGNLKDQYLALIEVENDTVSENVSTQSQSAKSIDAKTIIVGGVGLLIAGMLIVKVLK